MSDYGYVAEEFLALLAGLPHPHSDAGKTAWWATALLCAVDGTFLADIETTIIIDCAAASIKKQRTDKQASPDRKTLEKNMGIKGCLAVLHAAERAYLEGNITEDLWVAIKNLATEVHAFTVHFSKKANKLGSVKGFAGALLSGINPKAPPPASASEAGGGASDETLEARPDQVGVYTLIDAAALNMARIIERCEKIAPIGQEQPERAGTATTLSEEERACIAKFDSLRGRGTTLGNTQIETARETVESIKTGIAEHPDYNIVDSKCVIGPFSKHIAGSKSDRKVQLAAVHMQEKQHAADAISAMGEPALLEGRCMPKADKSKLTSQLAALQCSKRELAQQVHMITLVAKNLSETFAAAPTEEISMQLVKLDANIVMLRDKVAKNTWQLIHWVAKFCLMKIVPADQVLDLAEALAKQVATAETTKRWLATTEELHDITQQIISAPTSVYRSAAKIHKYATAAAAKAKIGSRNAPKAKRRRTDQTPRRRQGSKTHHPGHGDRHGNHQPADQPRPRAQGQERAPAQADRLHPRGRRGGNRHGQDARQQSTTREVTFIAGGADGR